MNEVTKIHLGRQAFTISTTAHHELRDYLDAIKQHVSDESVVDEVELRMVELLAEHGVSGEQVVLPADVAFLKEQLGDPKDFAEDGEAEPITDTPADSKRLFRDTDNAMLAGVAAGLANYFGVDVLIVRLLFVIATFTGGWGILIYIVLWLLVPEAKTSSERLQMAGKPVTINSLKEVVERADVKGAARRANNSLAGPINAVFSVILKLIGICFVVVGSGLLLSLAGGVTYAFLQSNVLLQDTPFPVGFKEHLLVYVAAAVAGIISLFIVLFGLSIYRRKWPIHAWITGTLIGLLFIGLTVGGALTADVAPQVRDRYNANVHTVTHTVKPFTTVNLNQIGNNETISYQTAATYSVSLQYYGHPNLSTVKTSVSRGVLTINSQQFNWHRDCQGLCIPNNYNLVITINSPNPPQVVGPDSQNMGPDNINVPVPPTPTPVYQAQ
jgi:phage shock protein PspC (stress-responsive transcriptional regulator)